jgi:hypothetical protein
MLRRPYRMLRKSLATRGALNTMLYAISWPLIIRKERKSLSERQVVQAKFDEQYGTDTSGFIPLSAFTISSPSWIHGVRYAPTSPQRFEASLMSLGLDRERFKEFTFVDVGSGKGATLLYAADLDFKAIYGVELVEDLHRIAEKNLALYKKAHIARSVCADASTFQMPSPPLIVFANYPFSSQELMDNVLRNISDSGEGPKYLVANQFPYDIALLPSARLRLISCRKDDRDRGDYAFEVL